MGIFYRAMSATIGKKKPENQRVSLQQQSGMVEEQDKMIKKKMGRQVSRILTKWQKEATEQQ